MITQSTGYSDKFIVVQVELPQMMYIVKRAILNWRNTVKTETQSENLKQKQNKKEETNKKNVLNLPT